MLVAVLAVPVPAMPAPAAALLVSFALERTLLLLRLLVLFPSVPVLYRPLRRNCIPVMMIRMIAMVSSTSQSSFTPQLQLGCRTMARRRSLSRYGSTLPGLGIPDGNPPSGVASGYVWFDVMALLVAPWLVYAAGGTLNPKRWSLSSGPFLSSIRRREPIGTMSASGASSSRASVT